MVSSVLHNLLHEIMSLVQLAIPIDWLDGTWDEYDHRGLVLVRDYPRNPREKASPPLEDGYVTPEERDVKPDDPRKVRREKKMEKYIEEHNQKRSTKLAKGAALDLKAHQSANTPTPQMYESEGVPGHQDGHTPAHHQDENTPAQADVKGVVGKRARRATATLEPGEQQVRKRRRIRSKQGSTRSTSPTDQTTPGLRRSTRTPKNPPKYT